MQLLYVEDELTTAKIVGALLRQEGFVFDTVYCGRDAVKLAKSKNYDIVLLDIMLPDLDGYEVIARLRKADVDTPFLIQTGLVDRARRDDGVSLGVAEYLIKPFNKDELVEGINKVIGRNRQVTEASLTVTNPIQPKKPAKSENRDHRRFNSLKSVRIVRPFLFDCVLLNMSYGGAALLLPHPVRQLPSPFTLDVYSGPVIECEICWRSGDKVGVKFI